jgi:hypothetical protein
MTRGYRKVSVQHSVGRYRIDIVIEGPHARLAVECDGDRWHGPDVWHRDRARQQVLERASWTFERIRGSAFYSDPDAALLPLWQRLAGLGIPTGDWWSTQAPEPVVREVSGPARIPDLVHAVDDAAADDAAADDAAADGGATSAAPAPEPAVPSGDRASPALLPYQAWTPRVLPRPDTAPLPAVLAGLQEIVAAEGPIHAQRAYRLYTLAAGGRRVGTEMRRAFHAATRQALRAGGIRQLDDEIVSLDEKTLYAPGRPTVLVRELGSRPLSDVPRSEVAKLIRYLGLERAADDVIKRAVLNAYGLVRLTVRTSQYLDECLSYMSRRSATSQPKRPFT